MDTPAKHHEGDKVQVEIGGKWHAGVVVSVGRWTHSSGNSYPVYTVRFPDGAEIRCGNNSTRHVRRIGR